jgi:hypothetical protein
MATVAWNSQDMGLLIVDGFISLSKMIRLQHWEMG